MALEWEIKLLSAEPLEPAAIAETVRAAGLELERTGLVEQSDTYLDTMRLDLAREGGGLRVRRRPDGARLHWKSAGKRSGVAIEREEIEGPWESEGLPRTARELPGAVQRSVEPYAYARALKPLAEIGNARERFLLTDPASGATAELAVDAVTAKAGRRKAHSFAELEIEALEGDPAPWERLAEVLRAAHPLEPSTMNKLERTLAQAGIERPAAHERVPLTPEMPFQQAAVEIFKKHFFVLQRNEPGTRLAEDIECLHDMRVSSRRLRAAFRLLGGAFRPGELEGYNALMAETGGELGLARDLDVFIDAFDEIKAGMPEVLQEDLQPFEKQLVEHRATEQERLLGWMSSTKRLRAYQRFEEFLENGAAAEPLGLQVGQVAPGLIVHTARRVYRRGAKVKRRSPAERFHRLRISLKKLRYAMEDFSDLYGKSLKGFVKSCKGLQDALGLFNDADVTMTWLGDWIERYGDELPQRTVLAVGSLMGVLAARREDARREFRAAYKQFDRDSVRQELNEALIRGL